MSEQEKLQTQGRAHAELKTLKANVATLSYALECRQKDMEYIAKLLGHFLESPTNPQTMKTILDSLGKVPTAEYLSGKVQELQLESEAVNHLERLTGQF